MKIQNIGEESIHNICSSQVIFTLSSVVKELVENSIDADATEIKIKLVENGIKLIQVNDNGAGIKKSNFENVCARHATSKITEFEDIHTSLNTLGFRGEALNSLCMLSDLHIVTKHDESSHGYLLKFDGLGRLSHEEPIARLRGTTVSCENIFKNIPIRKKDFIKNIKSQLSDLLLLMQQYAIIYSHIKFCIQNIVTVKGNVKNMNMLLTNGGKESIKNSVHTIYGKRNIGNLIDFNIDEEEWKLRAYISDNNSGRRDRDIQFYYINNRPIHVLKNVNKIINSIYREFNSRLYPIIICNILSDTKNFDINVTPDKREVFFIYENELCEKIKTSLVSLLTPKTSQLVDTHIGDYFLKANNIQLPMLGGSSHERRMLGRVKEEDATEQGGSMTQLLVSEAPQGGFSASETIGIGEKGKKTTPSWEGSSTGESFSEGGRDSTGGVKEEVPIGQEDLQNRRDTSDHVDHVRKSPPEHANMWPLQRPEDNEPGRRGSFTKSLEPQVCVQVKEEYPDEEYTPPVNSGDLFFRSPVANRGSNSALQVNMPSSYHRVGRARQGWQVEGSVLKKGAQGDGLTEEEAPRVQAYEYQLGDGSTEEGCEMEDHPSAHAFEYKLEDSPKLCVQEYKLEASPKFFVQENKLEDSPKLCVQEYKLEDSPKLCVQEYKLEDSPKLYVQEYKLEESPKVHSYQCKLEGEGGSPHYDIMHRAGDNPGEGELNPKSQPEGENHNRSADSPDDALDYTFEQLKENIKSRCIKSIPIDINMYINREQMKSGFDYDQVHVVNLTNSEKIKNIIFPKGKEEEKANSFFCLTDKKQVSEYADLFNGSLSIKEAGGMENQVRSTSGGGSGEDISFNNIDERQRDLYFKSNLFEKLQICGQFNKGFVISKIDLLYFQRGTEGKVVDPGGSGGEEAEPKGNSNYALFIIDQHAADEKSNFEKYNKIFTMKSQKLISKIDLELSPAQIYIIEKNLEIFLHNGFDVEIVEEPAQKRRRLKADDSADAIDPTNVTDATDTGEGVLMQVKVYLLSLPVFNGKILEVEDFMSLLHHLTEHPITYDKAKFQMFIRNKGQPNKKTDTWFNHNFPRPQKVWRILASKACRNAIMVGKPLNVTEMIKIKKKLSVLKNPWNCPHGRPTIKYIINDMDIKSCFENYYVKLYDEITNLVVTKNYDAYKYLFHNHAFFLIMSTKPMLGPLLKFQ
ncbi:DNA mismatch repair protein PMS1, putative [Plasmodium knowlesi strain H]|uniref:DNA mismatch repair protein PMS1, putative n=3 Tax=Plasmodium knowlesi TaxID=5850 RepID=A0A5K1U4Z5_PLAKH|nr:mismatch repair protein pms1-like protein [Plasmodium knowlesi strain H]OTN66474.1 putative DNA mismatch repair protein PMS1 [Plasmodium knowlesi]CAA9986375.1 DNA mismatch repair protein PMS1, putative [Plasmodium knowlesi strain H]SBO25640.1 DNA mismatch repair protein PMS1, putative [Plasmodium knowlesi strain H]SBO28361.1 DNA mismatch repair protein PMS1, putative [Plasmodium knowlesi strain H]VVS75849.1 DNA mismatch repair protein PMS1, putative [Plasmodium knowlesi strain H]|eukprot:XP_002257781.1 mismatch repair protein pms1-like protein [Plasmodium knowlesi strain H]